MKEYMYGKIKDKIIYSIVTLQIVGIIAVITLSHFKISW
jgi:hypothetical protein